MLNFTYDAAATLLPAGVPKYQLSNNGNAEVSPRLLSVDPWSLFDKTWTAVLGYRPHNFEFIQGKTPMSTIKETAVVIALYYVVIFGGRELMRSRPAFKLNTLFLIHNFYLTAISGGLLVLFAQQLIPGIWNHGLFDGICGGTGWTQKMEVLYYMNYLTKYLELIDTVFLVLKKKPLTFLHTYHHGATALLCYTQLVGKTPVSWVPITLNLAVHVVMYWYYFQAARGVKVWWKQYITMFQITQFVLDLGFIYFATYTYFAAQYMPSLPHVGRCGEPTAEVAAATGCGIITSYLFLFVMFYLSTYKKPSIKKAVRRASQGDVPSIKETGEITADLIRNTKDTIADSLPSGEAMNNGKKSS